MSSASRVLEAARPRSIPQPLTTICAALTAIGIVAFLVALAQDPQTAWLAFHTNWVYFSVFSYAGLILAGIFVIVSATWPGPLRRVVEGFAAWIPVSFVLAIVGTIGGDYLFEWKREGAVHGKDVWLNATRVYGSDLLILGILTLCTLWFLKTSTRPLLKNLADNGEGFGKRMAQRWTQGWRGAVEERDHAWKVLSSRTAPIMLFLILGWTLIVFDQIMSMEQTWYSNLFGAYVTWGGILTAVAATALWVSLNRNNPDFKGLVTDERMHDIGKLLFAFSIFWMYLFFSQYLVIWYGNLPEETQFFYDRLGDQFLIDKGTSEAAWVASWSSWDFEWSRLNDAYGWTAMAAWACTWIIPFWVLLGQRPKKTPWILGPVAAIVLFGLWLERNLLIWPSVIKDDSWSWLGVYQILIALGFAGSFCLVFLLYTRIFPTLAVPVEDE